ncbi:hypothetical protein PG991_008870 [Apiospora marii]|uniref:Uncharacterized protein n=1 Tax=Apiospora marii TaxID=335849 RepID=A0ABR1RMG3_9PEZI
MAIEESQNKGRLAIELPGYNANLGPNHDPVAIASPVIQQDYGSGSSQALYGAPKGKGGKSGGGGAGSSSSNPIVVEEDEMEGVERQVDGTCVAPLDELAVLDNRKLSEGYQPKVSSIIKNALKATKAGVKAKVKSKLSQGGKESPVRAAQLKESMVYRMAMGEVELLTLSYPGEGAALISQN